MTATDNLKVGDLIKTDWLELPLEEVVDVEALVGSEK
jgi:hypothetical protein